MDFGASLDRPFGDVGLGSPYPWRKKRVLKAITPKIVDGVGLTTGTMLELLWKQEREIRSASVSPCSQFAGFYPLLISTMSLQSSSGSRYLI